MTLELDLINRRDAIRRVSAIFGGVALVGGTGLLTACERAATPGDGSAAATPWKPFTPEEIAFLDEIAETILPETRTPGAKAAKTGAFMALMVTDAYGPADQRIFRDGMQKVDAATEAAHKVTFMAATPEQRLAVLQVLDREQKRVMDGKEAADRRRKGLAPLPVDEATPKAEEFLPDARKEGAQGADANPAAAISHDTPTHYFRMMKELALLGYFTSEIGYTKAMRYEESPGRFDPCIPYTKGETSWAAHA